jgi:hypothetical protein
VMLETIPTASMLCPCARAMASTRRIDTVYLGDSHSIV